jgi:hypothetical protein
MTHENPPPPQAPRENFLFEIFKRALDISSPVYRTAPLPAATKIFSPKTYPGTFPTVSRHLNAWSWGPLVAASNFAHPLRPAAQSPPRLICWGPLIDGCSGQPLCVLHETCVSVFGTISIEINSKRGRRGQGRAPRRLRDKTESAPDRSRLMFLVRGTFTYAVPAGIDPEPPLQTIDGTGTQKFTTSR